LVSYTLATSTFTSPLSGTIAFNPDDRADLENMMLYVNIHTVDFVDGESRGQITAVATSSHEASWGRIRALYR
jgi:hypothetical protein